MLKTVLFDLDGTLVPFDLAMHGYDPEKLTEGIWSGVREMVKNDGSRLNEEIWWEAFVKIFGEQALADKPYFEEFYIKDFDAVKIVSKSNPRAKETVDKLHACGIRTVLATNPVFPAIATEKRMGWAGLAPDDFELYTTYENSHFCKPNLEYYKEILAKIDCRAEDCLMVGNDVEEDMVAKELGIKVFLLKDCLINSKEKDISEYPQGSFDELWEYIEALLKNS